MTWDIVKSNPNKPWDYWYMSCNQNITWDIVLSNLDKRWNWSYLSYNFMLKSREKFINNLRIKIIKANIIKRYWRNYSCNPIYPFAKKKILKRLLLINVCKIVLKYLFNTFNYRYYNLNVSSCCICI